MANSTSHITAATMGVLLDLDGVLIDSEGLYSRFWSEMDRRFPTGVEHFDQVIKGFNLQQILGGYFPDERVQRHIHALLDDYQLHMRYEFFPGVSQFLEQLNSRGVPVALVTSSDDAKMNAVYSQHPWFKPCLNAIVTGDMVQHTKPHPECFLTGARLLDRDIRHCVVFEDSFNGLAAARASGALVMGVATTNPADQLVSLCDRVVAGVAQLDVDQLTSLLNDWQTRPQQP